MDSCPTHGPVQHIPDSLVPPRAIITAPSVVTIRRLDPGCDGRTGSCLFIFSRYLIVDIFNWLHFSVHGAFAATAIAARTAFGPVESQLLDVPLCLGEDQFLLKV